MLYLLLALGGLAAVSGLIDISDGPETDTDEDEDPAQDRDLSGVRVMDADEEPDSEEPEDPEAGSRDIAPDQAVGTILEMLDDEEEAAQSLAGALPGRLQF
ncbi:MAG: hypothetical protein JJU07_10500 [Natronohydrobacter sp.]|nr:hypothetical protein [Natronohydrobacter sp.]